MQFVKMEGDAVFCIDLAAVAARRREGQVVRLTDDNADVVFSYVVDAPPAVCWQYFVQAGRRAVTEVVTSGAERRPPPPSKERQRTPPGWRGPLVGLRNGWGEELELDVVGVAEHEHGPVCLVGDG